MPAARLPPGLYERLLSLALDRDIRALDPMGVAPSHRSSSGPPTARATPADRPIAITWRLRVPMPSALFEESRVAAG